MVDIFTFLSLSPFKQNTRRQKTLWERTNRNQYERLLVSECVVLSTFFSHRQTFSTSTRLVDKLYVSVCVSYQFTIISTVCTHFSINVTLCLECLCGFSVSSFTLATLELGYVLSVNVVRQTNCYFLLSRVPHRHTLTHSR